jgi:hypothetical protein
MGVRVKIGFDEAGRNFSLFPVGMYRTFVRPATAAAY